MLRLLIVDDEPDIADSLYTLLQERFPFELDLYKAYSGKKALEWLKRGKFDLVLTDIRMPVLSGMELHKHIRRLWPRCRVIFLTGHSEFDYVYEAISHDNTSYLLKTEGHEVILETVHHAISEIEGEQQIEGLMVKAMQHMEQSLPLLQNELLTDLLHGEADDALERGRQFAELRIPLHAEMPVLLMASRLVRTAAALPPVTKAQLHTGMKVILEQYGYSQLQMSYVFIDKNTMIWFVQPAARDTEAGGMPWDEVPLAVQEVAEHMEIECLQSFATPLLFLLDRSPCGWDEVADRWALLRHELDRQSGNQNGLIQAAFDENEYTRARILRKAEQLGDYLAASQENDFMREWEWFVSQSTQTELIHSSLSLLFLRHMHRFNQQERLAVRTNLQPLLQQAELQMDAEQLLGYYLDLAMVIFELQRQELTERRDHTIERIKQYIQEHLGEDLSLVRLSELVQLNPSYLSRAFKKATGMNLLSYIHETKLKEASRLLLHSDMKIHEISRVLGFVSPPHFTRFFKKASGHPPQDYRNLEER
ncbi:response regulator transcription factor [Paenibacillus nasutitermitis]|uniref:DNA-binding response regulator n=1 Tax=Paenibacillus nasutitermitis TaxID=1652958 RepID=A0A916ZFV3_9BACL|nr:response regulator [Paenibacillus nasutitermitis]GGD95055.1 DNA-binding response regulator [Paenibacillus nasutitermitis]